MNYLRKKERGAKNCIGEKLNQIQSVNQIKSKFEEGRKISFDPKN